MSFVENQVEAMQINLQIKEMQIQHFFPISINHMITWSLMEMEIQTETKRQQRLDRMIW